VRESIAAQSLFTSAAALNSTGIATRNPTLVKQQAKGNNFAHTSAVSKRSGHNDVTVAMSSTSNGFSKLSLSTPFSKVSASSGASSSKGSFFKGQPLSST
jgi:hypothetical protein